MGVGMRMGRGMIMCVVAMRVRFRMLLGMIMLVVMLIIRDVDIKFHARNATLKASREVKVVAVQVKLVQFAFELMRANPQVHQSADEHIAADTSEKIEV